MILERNDAIHAATKLMTYFRDFERIDDYFRARKIERVKDIPTPLPGFGLEDDMFQNYDCLLYTSPSPRDRQKSRMPASA